MSLALVISVLANCLLLVGTKQVLGLFGRAYAEQAAWSLHILVLAAFPLIIKNHYISICRIQDRIAQAMLGIVPGSLLELGAAILGAHLGGLVGLSICWVAAIYIESMFMFRTVYRTIRSLDTSTVPARQLPGTEAIWLVETSPMSAIGQTYRGIEAIWLRETSLLPAVRLPDIRKAYMEPGTGKKSVQQYENWHGSAGRHRLKPPRLQRYTPYDSDPCITDKGVASQFLKVNT